MNYLDIIQDREIVAILGQIDILKQADCKYFGILHTLSTIEFAKQLSKCFDLTDEEENLLLIACALHNIGHLNGKNLHAQTGAEMAKVYLTKHGMDIKDVNIIGNAISSHLGRRNDNFYDSVSACLILADKMDFGSTRIKPNFEEMSFEDEVLRHITKVNVSRTGDVVELMLGGIDVDWKVFVQSSAYAKLYRCFETVCKKYNYSFVVRVKKVN
ncbi:MAG: HD domain-containing protein [Clostridia bacterium]|nr:HD domain-containing protein [Clostridia bacterium]